MSKTVNQNSNFCNNFVTDIYRHHKDTICCHQSEQVEENEDVLHVTMCTYRYDVSLIGTSLGTLPTCGTAAVGGKLEIFTL